MPTFIRADSINISTELYPSASHIPTSILEVLVHDARNSNIILPLIEKSRASERQGTPSPKGQFWIACFTAGGRGRTLDFLLSCTDGPIGKYPIFIYSTRPINKLDDVHLTPRIDALVDKLLRNVPPHRVFSVFAVRPVASAFAESWSYKTGIKVESEPYYAATFTYCTSETLHLTRSMTMISGLQFVLRRATEHDIPATAELCYGFASTSAPFILSKEDAVKEATLLTRKNQLWVHEITQTGYTPEIASIVAVTRSSETVSAITKVYTPPKWRKQGCALRLVRHVSAHLLRAKERGGEGKQSVVLYVAHDNRGAEKVYERVGFAGLSAETRNAIAGVEPWLELGLDQSKVQMGHW